MSEDVKSAAAALVVAQLNMTKAVKQTNNPHFRAKYADLGSVMDACLTALNEAGLALIQPVGEEDGQRYCDTILIHSESGQSLSCRVPLIVDKNNMQGYGSAVTYARRYGLMAMAGIAPEDDDGNAAASNPPRKEQARVETPKLSPEEMRDKLVKAISDQTEDAALEKLYDQASFKKAFDGLDEPKQLEVKAAYSAAKQKLNPIEGE